MNNKLYADEFYAKRHLSFPFVYQLLSHVKHSEVDMEAGLVGLRIESVTELAIVGRPHYLHHPGCNRSVWVRQIQPGAKKVPLILASETMLNDVDETLMQAGVLRRNFLHDLQ